MFRSSVAIDEPRTAGTPLPTRCAGHLPLKGNVINLRKKIPAVTPKRLPLEGKLSAKQTEEVSPYV